ncbi:MAG: AEC family transporter [Planctomycetota bacterium]|nr:AEC family transporter [Planctomycetota bacterium]
MSEFVSIASNVSGVLMVMAIGAIARWFGWLSAASDRSLAVMIANVLLPALFLDRIASSGPTLADPSVAPAGIMDTLIPPLVGFGCTSLGFVIAMLIVRAVGPLIGIRELMVQQTFIFTVGIANYGYIPIPLAEQFFPEAVVPLLLHNVGVDIAMWSLGILIISGDIRNGWKRVLYSPPLWAMLIAVSIQQLGLAPMLPNALMKAAASLGQCAIPVGLMLSGAIIVDHWKDVQWKDAIPTLSLAFGIRLLVLPIVFLSIAKSIRLPDHLNEVLLLQAAMPAASFPIIIAKLYHGDLPTALRVVVGTSIISLITIPIWIVVGKQFLGIP